MVEWTVERIREYAAQELYGLYMEDSQQWWRVFAPTDEKPSETQPLGRDLIREAKQLVQWGWAAPSPKPEYAGAFVLRMTPAGRDAWEAYLTAKEKDPATAVLRPSV